MKGDAEQLISEAISLLEEDLTAEKPKNPTEEPARPVDQTDKDSRDFKAHDIMTTGRRLVDEQERKESEIEKAEIDRSKDESPERSFWFKLAEKKF